MNLRDLDEAVYLNQLVRVNENQLNTYRNEVKDRIDSCQINDFLKNLPKETIKTLFKQERALKNNIKVLDEKKSLVRVLSNRSKKNPSDLLMNRTDTFRQIKQIREKSELQKPFEQRFGKNSWIMGLRRFHNSKASRYKYVEIGRSNANPIWSIIMEPKKDIEKIIPDSNLNRKDIDRFLKNDYFMSSCNKFSHNPSKLEVNTHVNEGVRE